MRPFHLVLASSTLWLSTPSTLHFNTNSSSNDYIYTTVSWGTPAQSFKVLVDTTDHSSWVYGSTAKTSEATFDRSASTSYVASSDDPANFKYQGSETAIDFAYDMLTINGETLTETVEFALAQSNFTVTDNEGLSGFLSLDRSSSIVSDMVSDGLIDSETLTLDISNNKVYFGSYSVSDDADSVSNETSVASTTNDYLESLLSTK